jgi:predicted RNase H-like nuclease (RuvC/YqgF family)
MQIDTGFIFSLLSAVITLGGLCVGFGILKGKVDQNVEENKSQTDRIGHCATKEEVALVIKQADEDRRRNGEQHQKLFDTVNEQAKEIGALKAILTSVKDTLEELKQEIRDGLKDLRDEIKESRKG